MYLISAWISCARDHREHVGQAAALAPLAARAPGARVRGPPSGREADLLEARLPLLLVLGARILLQTRGRPLHRAASSKRGAGARDAQSCAHRQQRYLLDRLFRPVVPRLRHLAAANAAWRGAVARSPGWFAAAAKTIAGMCVIGSGCTCRALAQAGLPNCQPAQPGCIKLCLMAAAGPRPVPRWPALLQPRGAVEALLWTGYTLLRTARYRMRVPALPARTGDAAQSIQVHRDWSMTQKLVQLGSWVCVGVRCCSKKSPEETHCLPSNRCQPPSSQLCSRPAWPPASPGPTILAIRLMPGCECSETQHWHEGLASDMSIE